MIVKCLDRTSDSLLKMVIKTVFVPEWKKMSFVLQTDLAAAVETVLPTVGRFLTPLAS